MMRTFLALLVAGSAAAQSNTVNLAFTWDPATNQPPDASYGYKFYEKVSTNRVLLGGATGSNRVFTVSNYVAGTSRRFVVTATNLWGESPECPAYVAPVFEGASTNLRPVSWFFTNPVPGTLELSLDLTNFTDRIRIVAASTNWARIELVQSPRYPLLYGRVKPPVVFMGPPVPH